ETATRETRVERTEGREIEAREGAAWRRGLARVWRNPGRALAAAAGAALLVLVVWWLVPDAVATVTLQRREVVETLVTTGRVRSASRTEVGAPLVGTVERVEVREGDRVAAGQLLLVLEDAEPRAAAAEARARLAAAEASLGRVTSVDLPSAGAELDATELEARPRRRD